MMFIDSHCHINFPDLSGKIEEILLNMKHNQIDYALAVSVSKSTFIEVLTLAEVYPNIFASVGLHPDNPNEEEFSVTELIEHSLHPKVIAIGETGLDYHWCQGDLTWQQERFVSHIQASHQSGLPLIIHSRDAATDTLRLLQENQAHHAVLHCFTEDKSFAKSLLDQGLYISFSGIVTFKNAKIIQEACQYIPDDRLLIETDAPYLAPVPYRGKLNQPAYVKHTAEFVASLRKQTVEHIAQITTDNFFRLFNKASASK